MQTVKPGAGLRNLAKDMCQTVNNKGNLSELPSTIIILYTAIAVMLNTSMVKRRIRMADIISAKFGKLVCV